MKRYRQGVGEKNSTAHRVDPEVQRPQIPIRKECATMFALHTLRPLRSTLQPGAATHIPEPPTARFLFADTRMAWFWLLVRVYVGWQWLVAGIEKLTGASLDLGHLGEKVQGGAWVFVPNTGASVKG